MTTRFEKAVNGLKQIADRYSKQHQFEFSTNQIKIKSETDKTIWLLLYITFLILVPIGVFVYLVIQKNSDPLTMVLTIGLASYFGITLYSILHGQQTLTVDFVRTQFILENVHKLFIRQKGSKYINFSQVHNVTLKQKALRYNNKWTRITFCDTNGNSLAYIDLGADFPDSIIADKIKFFLGVVLLTFNEKNLRSA